MKPPILSENDIETRAEEVLREYELRVGKTIGLPIPIEKVVHKVFDLPVEWEPIPTLSGGRSAVSKLRQPRFGVAASIILNRDLIDTRFRTFPGLEQTAIAHEAGHAAFHLERGRLHQLDFGFEITDDFVSDAAGLDDVLVEAIAQRGPVGDDWWREWQAHTFMRHVLMPRRLLLPVLHGAKYRRWSGQQGLYELRERCNVTISALVVQLSKLGYRRVDQRSEIHDVTPLARGQRALGV